MKKETEDRNKNKAFTLAEVLITLGIIGVVASLTIPNVVNYFQEREMVTRLLKFNSTLQQAVQLWKQDIDCNSDIYTCLSYQGITDNQLDGFEPIAKFMKITSRAITNSDRSSADWLPENNFNYYGNIDIGAYGKVAKTGSNTLAYLLNDGTTFSVDIDPLKFCITVDVNGKKLPNRVGKDVFNMTLGGIKGYNIKYYPTSSYAYSNTTGLCPYHGTCNPDNTDPTKDNGASPTAYVILHNKLPDFNALSQTVAGFKP